MPVIALNSLQRNNGQFCVLVLDGSGKDSVSFCAKQKPATLSLQFQRSGIARTSTQRPFEIGYPKIKARSRDAFRLYRQRLFFNRFAAHGANVMVSKDGVIAMHTMRRVFFMCFHTRLPRCFPQGKENNNLGEMSNLKD
jgi:hypothetical protein